MGVSAASGWMDTADLRGMTASLGIASSDANGWTLARDHNEPEFASGFVGLDALNTGAYLIGFASIVIIFVVKEVNAF